MLLRNRPRESGAEMMPPNFTRTDCKIAELFWKLKTEQAAQATRIAAYNRQLAEDGRALLQERGRRLCHNCGQIVVIEDSFLLTSDPCSRIHRLCCECINHFEFLKEEEYWVEGDNGQMPPGSFTVHSKKHGRETYRGPGLVEWDHDSAIHGALVSLGLSPALEQENTIKQDEPPRTVIVPPRIPK